MFVVMEIQAGNKTATLVNSYEDRNAAEQKYHSILAAASVSKVPVHSAVMLTKEGYFIKSEVYKHEEEAK